MNRFRSCHAFFPQIFVANVSCISSAPFVSNYNGDKCGIDNGDGRRHEHKSAQIANDPGKCLQPRIVRDLLMTNAVYCLLVLEYHTDVHYPDFPN